MINWLAGFSPGRGRLGCREGCLFATGLPSGFVGLSGRLGGSMINDQLVGRSVVWVAGGWLGCSAVWVPTGSLGRSGLPGILSVRPSRWPVVWVAQ